MKKILLLSSLIWLCACHTNGSQDYGKKGQLLIKDLRKDFEKVHSWEDLMHQEAKIKKKMRKLTLLMMKASDAKNDRKLGFEGCDILESDRFRYEMHRVCEEVEGANTWIEEVQADMLDRLDIYERKSGKKEKRKIKEA